MKKSINLDGGDQTVFVEYNLEDDFGELTLEFCQRSGCTLSSKISMGGMTKADVRKLSKAIQSVTLSK